jgi:23S rRNA (uracil1939-C5)-methyltransferase
MGYELENKYKKDILGETLARADVELKSDVSFVAPQSSWRYRNKMEYSFFGDEQGLHLALFNRGSHRKQIVAGSSIARPEIDKAAQSICKILSDSGVRAGDLKSLIIRCNQSGECVAALITRNESFGKIDDLKDVCKGLIVVFSNPLSPASVRTKDLYTFGYIELTDTLLGNTVKYDVFSFFQVNLPIFEDALKQMQKAINDESIVDMYAGVGSIGAALGKVRYSVESDPANTTHAKENIGPQKVIEASSEKALDYIERKSVLIVDPPRSGLHKVLVEKILEICPEKVVYLSCNPSTQARDLKLLSESYGIETITGYNFFPRTPHIESLAILVRQ